MPPSGQRLLEQASALALPAVILAGVAALVFVSRGALARSPRFLADPAQVEVVQRPAWMPEEVAAQLARQLADGLGPPASLLREEDLRAWEAWLTGASPWVRSVRSVSPRFPYQVELHMDLRRPVLVVDEDLLLAASGTVLGTGRVELDPAPLAYAGPLSNEDLLECAAAAGEIRAFHAELSELGVRLERVGITGEGLVVFTTDGGVNLEWGRSARRRRLAALDLPQRRRIQNLGQVVEEWPGLEGVSRVQLWLERPRVFPRR